MRKILSKIFRIRYILTALLLSTILFLLFNPDYLYEKGEYFKTERTIIDNADQFTLLPENHQFDVCYFREGSAHFFSFFFMNLENRKLKQIEQRDFSIYSSHHNAYAESYFDALDDKVYTIATRNRADYYLFEVDGLDIKHYKFFHHDLFDSLCDSIITINNIKFYSYNISGTMKDNLKIIPYKDGYKIILKNEVHKRLRSLVLNEVKNNELYKNICGQLNKHFKVIFKPEDLYELMEFFLRNLYYHKRTFPQKETESKGFLFARIIGVIDSNDDNHNDLIIQIHGDRWLPNILLCFDKYNQKVLWKKEFSSGGLENFEITDIDNDNNQEIIFTSTAPLNQHPIDMLRKKYIGSTYYSQLYILNNNGEVKKINRRPAIITSPFGYYRYKYLYLPEQNLIVLGLYSRYDNDKKNIQIFDLKRNTISNLDITYECIIGIARERKNIVLMNREKDKIDKIILNNKFEVKKIISKKINENYLNYDKIKNILNKQNLSIIWYPHSIINNNLDVLYKSSFIIEFPKWKNNEMFCIEKKEGLSYLVRYHFERNRTLNPYVIIIFLVEILLIITYLFIFQRVKIPLNTGTSSYFVLYTIFGKLYYWQLYGRLRTIYKLPKNIALSKEIPEKIFRDIAEEIKIVFERSFLLFKYKVYEILTHDEFQIIQRISHDLKNQVLLAKLTMEQFEKESTELWKKDKGNRFFNNLNSSFKEISNAAAILSSFSHIKKLYKEEIELKEYIELTLSKYLNHPFYENIKIEFKKTISTLNLDKNLFQIAFKNIINNALEAITEKDKVIIEISETRETVMIEIRNPCSIPPSEYEKFYQIGFSTKEAGSGLGIPISKTIIEKHDGTLSINCENNEFTVTVILPKINKM